jgi:transglutaminase/protease-like cytokinesis protein 3
MTEKKFVLRFWFVALLLGLLCFTPKIAFASENVEKPVLISATAVDASSIKIQWKKVENAGLYAIYRKEEDSSYKLYDYCLPNGKSKQSYTDSKVLSKTNYTYSVASIPTADVTHVNIIKSTISIGGGTKNIYLSWDKSNYTNVYRYLIVVNDVVVDTEENTKKSVQLTLLDSSSDVDNSVYALSKGNWSGYDKTGVSAKTSIKASKIKSTKLVATNKIRINWTKSPGATGYYIYRKPKGSSSYKKIATVTGDTQTYCYNTIKKNTTYYYTVKAFTQVGKSVDCDSYDKTGFKVCYKATTINPNNKLYSKGRAYRSSLTSKQLKEVQSAVKKFFNKYITSDMTNIEKIVAAQVYLKKTCVYADSTSKNKSYTAWGALVYKNKNGYHEATCYGYSLAMQALCDSMGITCELIYPNSKAANPNHLWNRIKLGKKWYMLDAQVNSNYGLLNYFLVSGKYYKLCTGETWNTKTYTNISSKDYSQDEIVNALYGYRITNGILAD